MTSEQMTVALVVLAGLGLISIWTSGARTGRKAERAVREVTRLSGNAIRALLVAAVLVGVQWAVITLTDSAMAWAVALGVPAVFAGTTVARLLAVTQVIRTVARGGRR